MQTPFLFQDFLAFGRQEQGETPPEAPAIAGASITGTPNVGQTLTAVASGVTGSPFPSLSYQWTRDAVNISGATSSTYVLQAADDETAVRVVITATNTEDSASATSDPVSVTYATPSVTGATITGTPQVGQTLTASATITGAGGSTTYQWRRDTVNISGATASTYELVDADDETDVDVVVTYENSGGSDSDTATAVSVLYATPSATGSLTDVTIDQNSGNVTRDAGALFTGAVGGAWSVTVNGTSQPTIATIDSAGVVTVLDDTPITAATILATYTNSGGSASRGFSATVNEVATAPAAFVVGDWTLATRTDKDRQVLVDINSLPDDGGSTITALEYRLDGGTWTALDTTNAFTGEWSIDCGTDAEVDIELRAVNAVGNGAASDVKSATPGVGTNELSGLPANITGSGQVIGGTLAEVYMTYQTASGTASRGARWTLALNTSTRYRLVYDFDTSTDTAPDPDNALSAGTHNVGMVCSTNANLNSGFQNDLLNGASSIDATGFSAGQSPPGSRVSGIVEFIPSGATIYVGFVDYAANTTSSTVRLRDWRVVEVPDVLIPLADTAADLSAAAGATDTLTLSVPIGESVAMIETPTPGTPVTTFTRPRGGLETTTTNAHIWHVTNRNASGAGSLAEAVSTAGSGATSGPRIIVFDVGGEIAMTTEPLQISRANVWIAGQTAVESSGSPIYITGRGVDISASNVVVEHIYSVLDDPANATEADQEGDCFGVNPISATISNILIRHCGMFGSIDECVAMFPSNNSEFIENFSLENCFLGYPVKNGPNRHEDNHNYGPLVGTQADAAFVNNTMAGFRARTPRLSGGTEVFIAGNYTADFYNDGSNSTPRFFAPVQHANQGAGITSTVGWNHETTIVSNFAEVGAGGYDEGNQDAGVREITGYFSSHIHYNSGANVGISNLYETDNYFETGITLTLQSGSLGTNGRALERTTESANRIALTEPNVWADLPVVHWTDVRSYGLAHYGPSPDNPAAILSDCRTLVGAQAAKAWVNRDDMWIASDPAQAVPTAGSGTWTEPANPFTANDYGITNIEATLHALTVEQGGLDPYGVGVPLWVTGGGKLLITAAGSVTWTGAPTAHDPLNIVITYTDGTTETITVETVATP